MRKPLIRCVLIAALLSLVPAAGLAQPRSILGTNIEGLDDWSTEFTFVDAFKTSRPWFSGTRTTWQDGRPLDLDARGWVRSLQPGQVARTLMYWELGRAPGRFPAGRYVITFDGDGTIEYALGRLLESAPGRHVLDLDPARDGGIILAVTATNPANYVRNIRVRVPTPAPDGEVFYPRFLETLRNYRVIRFTNWMYGQQNHIVQERWEDRPTLDDARWSGTKGAPVEIMVDLANRLNADPWFNIHHLADDNYVRQFALLVRQRLNPNLKVYVEHSNEVFNYVYRQAAYAQQRGLALGLSADPFEAQMRYHALRSTEIFRILEEVFPRERLVRVLGSFNANPWVTRTLIGFRDTASHTDVVAIAPYLGIPLPLQPQVASWSPTDVIRQLEVTVMPQVMTWVREHMTIARQAGLGIVSYEGGQHLVGMGPAINDDHLNEVYTAANRHPDMGRLYSRYLQEWSTVTGGALFMHLGHCFRYDRFGRFGSLEYLDQPRSEAYKYDALQRWIEESGPPPGSNPPTSFAATVAGRTVTLSWRAPIAGASPISYVLEAGTAPGVANLATFDTTNALTSITFHNVPPGVYYVRARTRSVGGLSAASNEILVVVR